MLDVEKMEARRKELGMSQADAARKAGLAGKQVWNDIVQGRRRNITIETLDAIGKALETHPRNLLRD